MLHTIPSNTEIIDLIGKELYDVWISIRKQIASKYDMDILWNNGGKRWTYEYKYRRGGKTLITLYLNPHDLGCMFIFGKVERDKFELKRHEFSVELQHIYDEAQTYHDGKWFMIHLKDMSLFKDIDKLLLIKRRPNK